MNISVIGAKDRELTNLLKLAAESFADKLLSKQLKKNINLKIQIIDDLDVGGYCDCEESWPYPPRDFTLEIARTKKKIYMFLVLAHEMVHLKQMAKGEMKDKYVKNKYYKVWQGQLVEDNVSYWDQPWEIEAYGLENSLVAKFLLEHDLYKTLKQKPSTWFAKLKREEQEREAQNNN
jgi:hypothetical protein